MRCMAVEKCSEGDVDSESEAYFSCVPYLRCKIILPPIHKMKSVRISGIYCWFITWDARKGVLAPLFLHLAPTALPVEKMVSRG